MPSTTLRRAQSGSRFYAGANTPMPYRPHHPDRPTISQTPKKFPARQRGTRTVNRFHGSSGRTLCRPENFPAPQRRGRPGHAKGFYGSSGRALYRPEKFPARLRRVRARSRPLGRHASTLSWRFRSCTVRVGDSSERGCGVPDRAHSSCAGASGIPAVGSGVRQRGSWGTLPSTRESTGASR